MTWYLQRGRGRTLSLSCGTERMHPIAGKPRQPTTQRSLGQYACSNQNELPSFLLLECRGLAEHCVASILYG